MKYRWHWTFPIHISEHKKHTVYVGSQYVHRSTDFGQSWEVISPDLTLNLKSHQESSGGIAIDNLMTFDGSVLFAITESPLKQGLIWVGSNDGQIHLTRNGGRTWKNLTENIDMPPWGTISNIEASRFEKGTAYISVDFHQMGDFDPYIYKTENYGKTWKRISSDIPKSYSSFVHVVREDHQTPGVLYAGTDNGVYVSVNDGKHWTRIKNNLPPAPVYWISLQERFDDMVIGTYGRGFYILDDISHLRVELYSAVMDGDLEETRKWSSQWLLRIEERPSSLLFRTGTVTESQRESVEEVLYGLRIVEEALIQGRVKQAQVLSDHLNDLYIRCRNEFQTAQ